MRRLFGWRTIGPAITILSLSLMIYAGAVFTRRANDAAAAHQKQHHFKQSISIIDTRHDSDDLISRAIAVGTAFATLFQCLIFVKQLSVAKIQAEIMDRQAEFSSKQTTLMEGQLRATEISAEASQFASKAALATVDRPYLHITELHFTMLNKIDGSSFNNYIASFVNIDVKNVGRSPAVVLNIKYSVAIKDKPRIDYEFIRDNFSSYHRGNAVLAEGNAKNFTGHLSATLRINDVTKNWLHFRYYVIGQIEYIDPIRLECRVRVFLYYMPFGINEGIALYDPVYDYDRLQERTYEPRDALNLMLPKR